MKITVYKKTGCPWAAAVDAFLGTLNIPFQSRNMTTHPEYAAEARKKTGQSQSPTVEMDGKMIPDASVEDVAEALEQAGVST